MGRDAEDGEGPPSPESAPHQYVEPRASARRGEGAAGKGNLGAVNDAALMARLRVDPDRQLVGSQCSGALAMHRLGLVGARPLCTDASTRRYFDEQGIPVLDRAFAAHGNVATAGGCLSAQYLAAWVLTRTLGWERADGAIRYIAPIGEEDATVARVKAALDGAAG
jgi:transcriptional regulator GlxA family with amidase domain